MAVPHTASNFSDLLDKRVSKIFYGKLEQLPDRLPEFFDMVSSSDSYERTSEVGELPDFNQFTGTVDYQSQSQGYDTTATHLEFANGFQVTRDLFDDDRHNIWEGKPVALAKSYRRTQQKHGATLFNNAFSVDTVFYNNSEAVALCSDSHTTTSGASTSTGFDNLVTSSLTAVAVSAARLQMRGFRGDVAERIHVMPDKLVVPIDLQDRAIEIVKSQGQPDSGNNNVNPQNGRYTLVDWEYLTDTNNWFMVDSSSLKDYCKWYTRIPLEFGQAEELDTLVAKWRAYCRYSYAWTNWRFILGASVS